MSQDFSLSAVERTAVGKAAVRRLRRLEGMVPASVYGAGKEPQSIQLPENVVLKAFSQEAIYSHVVDLDVSGKKDAVIVKNVLRHPTKPKIMHIDFYRVKADQPITVAVPLHFIGEEEAPGVKEGGVISHMVTELSVSCLPKYLPEFIEVNISELEMDHSVHLSEVKLPANVELSQGEIDDEHDVGIVAIHQPKIEVEPEPELTEEEAAAAAAAEAEGEEAAEDSGEGKDESAESTESADKE